MRNFYDVSLLFDQARNKIMIRPNATMLRSESVTGTGIIIIKKQTHANMTIIIVCKATTRFVVYSE